MKYPACSWTAESGLRVILANSPKTSSFSQWNTEKTCKSLCINIIYIGGWQIAVQPLIVFISSQLTKSLYSILIHQSQCQLLSKARYEATFIAVQFVCVLWWFLTMVIGHTTRGRQPGKASAIPVTHLHQLNNWIRLFQSPLSGAVIWCRFGPVLSTYSR